MTAVYAHRGAHQSVGENTVEAFLEARRLGVDGVELDVRRSLDGALVVHHDPEIPGCGPLAAVPVADLPPDVPLLEAALDACDGLSVNVEIKNDPSEPGFDPDDAVADLVARVLADGGWTDRAIVSSFRLETVRAVRNAEPRLGAGLLVPVTGDPRAALELAAVHDLTSLHPFVWAVDAELVAAAQRRGVALHVWTVNEPHDMARLVELGVEALITDRPEEALAVARPG